MIFTRPGAQKVRGLQEKYRSSEDVSTTRIPTVRSSLPDAQDVAIDRIGRLRCCGKQMTRKGGAQKPARGFSLTDLPVT